jgi:hypothetical protein
MFWFVENTMRRLIPAGIPQYSRKIIYDSFSKGKGDESGGAQVFSFGDLKFGFIIWAGACLIALVAFVAELIYFYGKKYLQIRKEKREKKRRRLRRLKMLKIMKRKNKTKIFV